MGVNRNNRTAEISHSVPWRRIRIALRARFYRDIRSEKGKSLEGRIFGKGQLYREANKCQMGTALAFARWGTR